MNLFVVGTPLQLLNAIEARHALNLTDNHLVLVTDYNHTPETGVWSRLVCAADWETVHYLELRDARREFRPRYVPELLRGKLSNYLQHYYQYGNKVRVDRLAREFPAVDYLVLGNYHGDYGRHIANRLKYRCLCLVDDGTDVLLINEERKERRENGGTASGSRGSWWMRLKGNARKSILMWDVRQARNLLFFTAYDIEVPREDQLVRNDYSHFKKQIAPSTGHESGMFLGQCLVRDGYMSQLTYLDYLRRVRCHFGTRPLVYVPHPREPESLVNEIGRDLGFVIRKFDVPIEWQLMKDASRPSVLASFFCSALISCRLIYGADLKLKAFQIKDEDVMKWPDLVRSAYAYFSGLSGPSIEVVPL